MAKSEAERRRISEVRRRFQEWLKERGIEKATGSEVLMFNGVLSQSTDSYLLPHNRMGTDSYQLLKGDLGGLWSD
jgi:hypothetical protein